MTINEVPGKFFSRLNNSLSSGDYSLVLDAFATFATAEYNMIGPQKFGNPELIVDGLKSAIKKGARFVVSEPAATANRVAVNFDLYGTGPGKVPGTTVFTVDDKGKISKIVFRPGYNRSGE